MLHTETIAPATLGLLKRLMQDECLSRFVFSQNSAQLSFRPPFLAIAH